MSEVGARNTLSLHVTVMVMVMMVVVVMAPHVVAPHAAFLSTATSCLNVSPLAPPT
jgi:hypothetical protein